MEEYRVRVTVEKRRVSRPSRDNYLNETKRSRWVKTGIGQTSVFGEDLSEQMDLYDRLVEIVAESNRNKREELLKGLNI